MKKCETKWEKLDAMLPKAFLKPVEFLEESENYHECLALFGMTPKAFVDVNTDFYWTLTAMHADDIDEGVQVQKEHGFWDVHDELEIMLSTFIAFHMAFPNEETDEIPAPKELQWLRKYICDEYFVDGYIFQLSANAWDVPESDDTFYTFSNILEPIMSFRAFYLDHKGLKD